MWVSGQGHYAFWICRDADGQAVGTLGTARGFALATEIGSSRESATTGVGHVQDVLHWTAFVHHGGLGDEYFDLAGFAATPVTSKELGIRRFKLKWGGRAVELAWWTRERTGRFSAIVRTFYSFAGRQRDRSS